MGTRFSGAPDLFVDFVDCPLLEMTRLQAASALLSSRLPRSTVAVEVQSVEPVESVEPPKFLLVKYPVILDSPFLVVVGPQKALKKSILSPKLWVTD